MSLNVGLPHDIDWTGKIGTSLWALPVDRRLIVRKLEIDDDVQDDLARHTGEQRAVLRHRSHDVADRRIARPHAVSVLHALHSVNASAGSGNTTCEIPTKPGRYLAGSFGAGLESHRESDLYHSGATQESHLPGISCRARF